MEQFLSFCADVLKETSWVAVLISVISLTFSFLTYKNFARNDFSKKQLEIVINLVELIHNSPFDYQVNKYTEQGGSGTPYTITLFELITLYEIRSEQLGHTFELPILFDRNCNQIAKIKNIINHPLLPKSIADELVNFYCVPPCMGLQMAQVANNTVIVIDSKELESNIWDDQNVQPPHYFRTPSGFAFQSVTNLIACAKTLETSIINWLENKEITDINIRRDFNHTINK
jgi:hypothetical protein